MRHFKVILFLLALLSPTLVFSQITYYNADQFPVIGKISNDTETRYERLPRELKNTCRPPVWHLGKHTSGLAVRFKTNSTTIAAKWETLNDAYMNHMSPTGTKGLDLYTWDQGKWVFMKTGRPTAKVSTQVIIDHMKPIEREYMLYLPLYDGIVSLEIGIDSTKTITQPSLPFPRTEAPIVVYGTSITQGGCAARPGMSFTNILERRLNTEVINLGFSGNGRLDMDVAEVIAKKKNAQMFILDFAPNNGPENVKNKTIPFVNIIRKENPNTPIVLIENPIFPHGTYDQEISKVVHDKNIELKKCFQALKAKGDNNLYYISSDNLIGNDGEATVDGIHFTDLGFMRMADVVLQEIKKMGIVK